MEAVLLLVLTVLLMLIVMSPATWSSSSSSSAAAACDGELNGYPSSCIATRLDFVFSPATPYSLFDDESPSCNNTDSTVSMASNACGGEPVDGPTPPLCAPESA